MSLPGVSLSSAGRWSLHAVHSSGPSARLPPAIATEVLMRRIGLAVVLAGSFVLTPLAPEAQQAASVYQIGLLTLGSDPTRSEFWQKFLQAMHELNYVEGRNLI